MTGYDLNFIAARISFYKSLSLLINFQQNVNTMKKEIQQKVG
jgi:hypothetical protein